MATPYTLHPTLMSVCQTFLNALQIVFEVVQTLSRCQHTVRIVVNIRCKQDATQISKRHPIQYRIGDAHLIEYGKPSNQSPSTNKIPKNLREQKKRTILTFK